jgi:small subunit ribosomal protein S3
MGKKINPKIFRIGQTRNWDSRWFSVRNYSKFLQQDIQIKEYLGEKLKNAFVSRIEIERTPKDVNVIINSARPGVIIGRGGVGVEELKKEVSRKFIKNNKVAVKLNIKEVENVSLDAMIIALSIKFDIEKRIPFRRAMKQAILKVERAGAKGVKISASGRLNGVEIARTEKLISGKVPLHTIRADVDYAAIVANTMYGVIGIKVWIYRGDIFVNKAKADSAANKNSK